MYTAVAASASAPNSTHHHAPNERIDSSSVSSKLTQESVPRTSSAELAAAPAMKREPKKKRFASRLVPVLPALTRRAASPGSARCE